MKPRIHSGSYNQGPAQKGVSTYLIENLTFDLMNPELSCTFAIEHNSLIMHAQHKETKEVRSNYLIPLFQSANLQHIQLSDKFLSFFVKRCDEFKELKMCSPTEFKNADADSLILFETQIKQNLEETLKGLPKKEADSIIQEKLTELTFAHRFAAYSYTRYAVTMGLNSFLRGDLTYLRDLPEATLQEQVFTIMGILLINAEFQTKLPPYVDTELKHATSNTAYRIEYFSDVKDNPLNKTIAAAKELGTNTFVLTSHAFISTSMGRIGINVLDETAVLGDGSEQFVIYRFGEQAKKLITTLSMYKNENEKLFSPASLQYTVLQPSYTPFVFLDVQEVSPLDTEKYDQHMVRHAIRCVFNQYLSKEFKKSKPDDEDHHYILTDGRVIQKPNHGLAHAIRQTRNVDDVINFFRIHGITGAKVICERIIDNAEMFNLLCIAATFISVGRENELSGEKDQKGYNQARKAASDRFAIYMVQYFLPYLIEKKKLGLITDDGINELIKVAILCTFSVNYLSLHQVIKASLTSGHTNQHSKLDIATKLKHVFDINKEELITHKVNAADIELFKNLSNTALKLSASLSNENLYQLFTITHILLTAHLLETPRFLQQSPSAEGPGGINLLKGWLYPVDRGILPSKSASSSDFDQLWEMSLTRIRATGDRIIGKHNDYDEHLFALASLDPTECEKLVGLSQLRNTFIARPAVEISEHARNEIALNFLYYILRINNFKDGELPEDALKLSKEQLLLCLDSPKAKLFKLLDWGMHYLKETKDHKQSNDEFYLNNMIQKACAIHLSGELEGRNFLDQGNLNAVIKNNYYKILFSWATLDSRDPMAHAGEMLTFYSNVATFNESSARDFFEKTSWNINEDRLGVSPLHRALLAENIELAIYLINEKKARVTFETLELYFSHYLNYEKLLQILQQHLALTDNEILQLAILQSKDSDTIELLANRVDTKDRTLALFMAIQHNNLNAINVLMHEEIDSGIKDGSGQSLLHYMAKFYSQKSQLDFLEAKMDYSASDNDGNTPLHILALMPTRLNTWQKYLDHSDVNKKNHLGLTPLDILLNSYPNGDPSDLFDERVKRLFIKEAILNPHNWNDPVYILNLAIFYKWTNVINALLSLDLTKIVSETGYTALHTAVKFGEPSLIKKLLEQKLDINAKIHSGYTVLDMLAARWLDKPADSYEEIFNLLIENGADINTSAATPLIFAAIKIYPTNPQFFNLLLKQNNLDLTVTLQGKNPLEFTTDETIKCKLRFKNLSSDDYTNFIDNLPDIFFERHNLHGLLDPTRLLSAITDGLISDLQKEIKKLDSAKETAGMTFFDAKNTIDSRSMDICLEIYEELKYIEAHFSRLPLEWPTMPPKLDDYIKANLAKQLHYKDPNFS